MTREDNKTILQEFDANVARSKAVMHEMADVTTQLRVFGKCFIGQELNEDQQETFNDLSSKFFPF